MTPETELARLFAQVFPVIPTPDPLATTSVMRVGWIDGTVHVDLIEPSEFYSPVDADETNHGVCAQGDCSDES